MKELKQFLLRNNVKRSNVEISSVFQVRTKYLVHVIFQVIFEILEFIQNSYKVFKQWKFRRL